jgi:hypothetical protein
MKLSYMADGLFLYKKEGCYVVTDEPGNILKEAKTSKTCERFISNILQARRAAEKR